ncbi:MAG: FKBP-type peptidyl-prolyl cis-trans isomerase [Bacteroidota bacterium]
MNNIHSIMVNNIHSIIIFVFTFTLVSCGGQDNNKVLVINADSLKTPLTNVNKQLVKAEDEQIRDFIKRYGWDMNETGTGLRYLIYYNGNGAKAEAGKTAKINFEVKLITGDICYTSKNDGAKEFIIGKSNEISGLEEGILLMKEGDKAKFVIPSHLAFGLLGDEDKIPKRATLIYDVELIEIK